VRHTHLLLLLVVVVVVIVVLAVLMSPCLPFWLVCTLGSQQRVSALQASNTPKSQQCQQQQAVWAAAGQQRLMFPISWSCCCSSSLCGWLSCNGHLSYRLIYQQHTHMLLLLLLLLLAAQGPSRQHRG
jgi:hypothetical protein